MVARIQMNRIEIASVLSIRNMFPEREGKTEDEKITAVISLIAIILVYSAMKISANKPLLYSTLKPDTSSDSPSAKSKGVRLVSAKLVINQNRDRRGIRKMIQDH